MRQGQPHRRIICDPPIPPSKLIPLGIVAEFTLYLLEEVVGYAPFSQDFFSQGELDPLVGCTM